MSNSESVDALQSPGTGVYFIRYPEVLKYVETVRSHADENRDALGFLPSAAYADAARRRKLIVAASTKTKEYLGHIFSGGRFPNLRIVQTFVARSARGQRVGRRLIEALIEEAEANGWLSIRAAVASDLGDANAFYAGCGFVRMHSRPGGESRQRILNILTKTLDSPTLFDYASDQLAEGIYEKFPRQGPVPVLLIDLNVFLDVIHQRLRAEAANVLVAAALDGHIRLVVAEEFAAEFKRTSTKDTDPVLEFAKSLPSVPVPGSPASVATLEDVRSIIFPNVPMERLNEHCLSDLKHIHCAINNNAYAFVTADERLLKSAAFIEQRYGTKILHASEIAEKLSVLRESPNMALGRFAESELHVEDYNLGTARRAVSAFSGNFVEPLIAALANTITGVEVGRTGNMCCLAAWRKTDHFSDVIHVQLYADDNEPAVETAIELALGRLVTKCSSVWNTAVLVELRDLLGADAVGPVALRLGFKPNATSSGRIFQRLVLKSAITPRNWPLIRTKVQSKLLFGFPERLPRYCGADTVISLIPPHSARACVTLAELESYLNPAVFFLPDRDGVIVSLRGHYARQLLGNTPQTSLFPNHVASVFGERVYFSSKRNKDLLKKGKLILFYESSKGNGRSAVVAIARIVESEVVSADRSAAALLKHGVIERFEDITVASEVTATRFDNVLWFPRAVSFDSLRKLRIVDGANLVCAKTVTADGIRSVIEEAGLDEVL